MKFFGTLDSVNTAVQVVDDAVQSKPIYTTLPHEEGVHIPIRTLPYTPVPYETPEVGPPLTYEPPQVITVQNPVQNPVQPTVQNPVQKPAQNPVQNTAAQSNFLVDNWMIIFVLVVAAAIIYVAMNRKQQMPYPMGQMPMQMPYQQMAQPTYPMQPLSQMQYR
jgi:hypothetical protein